MARRSTRQLDQLADTEARPYRAAAADRMKQWEGTLRRRSRALDSQDQLLLRLYHERYLSFHDIAEITGINRGSVYRRLDLLRKRLLSPFAGPLLDGKCLLPGTLREIGVDFFIRHRSIPSMAEQRGVTVYQMRRQVHLIRGWILRDLCNADRVPKS